MSSDCRQKIKFKGKDVAAAEEDLNLIEQHVKPLLLTAAHVVVVDEGHEIKNIRSRRAKALMKIKTKKRVALTGYPLQNRLIEYYTMVNWIQKGLLYTEADFKENFVAPITAGRTPWLFSKSLQSLHSHGHFLKSWRGLQHGRTTTWQPQEKTLLLYLIQASLVITSLCAKVQKAHQEYFLN